MVKAQLGAQNPAPLYEHVNPLEVPEKVIDDEPNHSVASNAFEKTPLHLYVPDGWVYWLHVVFVP
jgi:hypothetical protein